jgi:hypothetical protein
MATLADRLIKLLQRKSGRSDREITSILNGAGAPQQPINRACRKLATRGVLSRRKRPDGRTGNYLPHSEDSIKYQLQMWLKSQGWQVKKIAWGTTRGIDIHACQGNNQWIIEVKGKRGGQQANRQAFLEVFTQILQAMNDCGVKYSIALPDLQQFRDLWQRLPQLAKSRLEITALFVDKCGKVSKLAK